jgi:hypothetical protein
MPLILWTDREGEGRYIISDRDGTVVVGPFFSLPDAPLVAQRLADVTRRFVFEHRFGASPLAGRIYGPSSEGAAGTSPAKARLIERHPWLGQVRTSVALIQNHSFTGARVPDSSYQFLESGVPKAANE